ncbi:hypothetical protein NUH88_15115 [Nisaea acidiphila]|uniref:SPOR domain-containing protein n=1 Tax=Nisaea acidiphila TaxID=1862145 RepID=A0A9J7AQV9_9PROT|nr:hypothetical protein [Nisaea acidiphila]UUX48732.1 hypothetical protein NUH88_15115 [Nisaea acidiphila]
MFRQIASLTLTAGLLAGFGTAETRAAAKTAELPQVLGLVATKLPVPLDCADGACSGFFSAFCLQEQRPKPSEGHVYDAAGQGDITMVVAKNDGSIAEFSAAGLLHFESTGAYTSVRISMDAARLASLDAASVSLRVPRRVSLLPRAEPSIAARPSAKDLEAANGEQRVLAEGYFENGSPRADAGAMMSRLINLLPAGGYAAQPLRDGVWGKAASPTSLKAFSPAGIEKAREAYDRCKAYGDQGYKVRLRGCLENSHDELMKILNDKYWDGSAGF